MLGKKLRELRLAAGLTLNNLAELTDLSTAFISNVERGATSPTINSLFKICNALNADITAILSRTTTPKVVVRKNERKEVFHTSSKVKYERTTEGTHSLKGVCISIPGDYDEEITASGHKRDEFGIITEGEMIMTLGGDEYHLFPGDSIYIASGTPHKYRRVGEGPCVSYWTFAHSSAAGSEPSGLDL